MDLLKLLQLTLKKDLSREQQDSLELAKMLFLTFCTFDMNQQLYFYSEIIIYGFLQCLLMQEPLYRELKSAINFFFKLVPIKKL
jgi:hypothetical protein